MTTLLEVIDVETAERYRDSSAFSRRHSEMGLQLKREIAVGKRLAEIATRTATILDDAREIAVVRFGVGHEALV